MVAKAMIYCLQQKRISFSWYKFMYILFLFYSSWLYYNRERLFIEHPQAQDWGPTFWRVAKAISFADIAVQRPYSDYKAAADKSPELAARLVKYADKYADYKESDLKEFITKSTAYKHATKEYNNGKWNKNLSDAEIYFWRKDQIERK